MSKKTFNITGTPKIVCEADYRDIRVFINDILHFIIPRPMINNKTSDSIRLQAYYYGSRKSKRYVIEWSNGNDSDYYGYDNFEVWKKILELLNDNI